MTCIEYDLALFKVTVFEVETSARWIRKENVTVLCNGKVIRTIESFALEVRRECGEFRFSAI